uniref:Uncharacterized protein n=1 Tax=Leersia perrieri TaxID=77586 RepID=A0A0D9Y0R4_9ORYZ
MKRNKEEEKTDKPWNGRRILGVAAAGAFAGAVAAGAFFLLSAIGESSRDTDKTADDDDPPTRTMKAPGTGGKVIISRDKFEDDTAGYFRDQRKDKAAVEAFK